MSEVSDQRNSRLKSRIFGVVRAVVSISIVAFLISRSNPEELFLQPDARLVGGVLLAAALIAFALFLSAVRWMLVLGDDAPRLGSLWRWYLIGWFFSLFLPTSVGGDAVRTVALVRADTPAGIALSSIVVERMLGVFALAGLLLVGIFIAPETPMGFFQSLEWSLTPGKVMLGLGALAAFVAVLVPLAARSARVRGLVSDAAGLLVGFRERPRVLGVAILASLGVQALYILVWITLAWAARLEVPFAPFLVYVPFISIAAMLPVTLSGLGLREGAWVLLLAPLGIATASAMSFSLLYYVAGLVVGVAGAILFLTSGLRSQLKSPIPDDPGQLRQPAAIRPA